MFQNYVCIRTSYIISFIITFFNESFQFPVKNLHNIFHYIDISQAEAPNKGTPARCMNYFIRILSTGS